MISVSPQYRQAIYAPIRKTSAKVTFEVLDNEAYEDVSTQVTSEAEISRKDQLTNKIRVMSRRYATFEKDYWRLDGSFHIPPRADEGNSELGWWSDEICAEDGTFSTPQVVEFTFAEEHNSMGVTVHFDAAAGEYASDFDIDVYRADGMLVTHEAVRENQKPIYTLIRGLDNYGKIVITIRKWAKPYRRARIVEVDFGVVKEYEGDKLIKVNLIEQMNVVGDKLPANELKFTVDNSDREFNILNPEGFYRFLRERQEVRLTLGVEVSDGVFEYINFLGYYLTDWQSDEGALTTTFTARNIFELLEAKEYNKAFSGTLYDLAVDVLTEAGITKYEIDKGLQGIPTNGFPEKINARKALQCIGIAGKAAVYQNRQGVITIQRFSILDDRTSYVYYCGDDGLYAGPATYPIVDSGWDMKNITLDNVYREPQIKLDNLVRTLVMVAYINGQKMEIPFVNAAFKEGATVKCDNPLIQSAEHAADVAAWILAESNLRAIYTVNWRQNPALEPGDIVLIEDGFETRKQSRIIKNEFEFAGYLSGKTETKGGV
ncbi:MAG: hypothetical protein BAA01_11600 [Bacillus thermozeamaize]|uniref:Uncharacterized protein n=1 Tax=Bacillus thermozeamaize TaxID=230954 RepID=A0A1Y3PKI0_9BACI|nr:MAG: hypothetical protein BAA01_11600 [Bacillus thermozeamaize]